MCVCGISDEFAAGLVRGGVEGWSDGWRSVFSWVCSVEEGVAGVVFLWSPVLEWGV